MLCLYYAASFNTSARHLWSIYFSHLERFSFECRDSKVIAELLWFCFNTLCNWFKKLAPPTQPIRYKTKANRDLITRVFPRLLGAGYVYLLRVLIGSLCCSRLLWLSIVIALVLVSRHSIENRSILLLSPDYVFLGWRHRLPRPILPCKLSHGRKRAQLRGLEMILLLLNVKLCTHSIQQWYFIMIFYTCVCPQEWTVRVQVVCFSAWDTVSSYRELRRFVSNLYSSSPRKKFHLGHKILVSILTVRIRKAWTLC